jgi:hypothetical protein
VVDVRNDRNIAQGKRGGHASNFQIAGGSDSALLRCNTARPYPNPGAAASGGLRLITV